MRALMEFPIVRDPENQYGEVMIEMPEDAEIKHVDVMRSSSEPALYCFADDNDDADTEERWFIVLPTGVPVHPQWQYVGMCVPKATPDDMHVLETTDCHSDTRGSGSYSFDEDD
jgi:hypothetical protein